MFDLFGRKRIAELEKANANLNRRLEQWENSLGKELTSIRNHAIVANRGMARLIVKLDPTYAQDELDPARRDDSDRIGNSVLKRLLSEHTISKQHD